MFENLPLIMKRIFIYLFDTSILYRLYFNLLFRLLNYFELQNN